MYIHSVYIQISLYKCVRVWFVYHIYFILSPDIGEWFKFLGHFFTTFFRFCWVPPASPWHSLRPGLEGGVITQLLYIHSLHSHSIRRWWFRSPGITNWYGKYPSIYRVLYYPTGGLATTNKLIGTLLTLGEGYNVFAVCLCACGRCK